MKLWPKPGFLQRRLELDRGDDFAARMGDAEALFESLKDDGKRGRALVEAVELASDENYYVAEEAVLALLACDESAGAFIAILESGSDQARILALQAARQLLEAQPQAVNVDLLRAIGEQLHAAVGDTRFVATRTMLHLANVLPDQTEMLKSQLRESLPDIFPALVDRFADPRFTPSQVAGFLADLCLQVSEAVVLVIASLHERRPAVREGIARTLCRISVPADSVVDDLSRLIEADPRWSVRSWSTAAWEAVSNSALPEDRWPIVRGVWQMVFFESDNEDAVPAGARFDEEFPLVGVLKHEGDTQWLYWPNAHGVTSSDRLLDDYGPILIDGLTDYSSELIGKPVAITGTYRDHRISAETIESRRRRSREET